MRYVLLISLIALTANIAKADWIILPGNQWCSKTDKNPETKKLKTYKEQADALTKVSGCKAEDMFIPNSIHVECAGTGDNFYIFEKNNDCGAFLVAVVSSMRSPELGEQVLASLKKDYAKAASKSK